jgi:hypothetical protein
MTRRLQPCRGIAWPAPLLVAPAKGHSGPLMGAASRTFAVTDGAIGIVRRISVLHLMCDSGRSLSVTRTVVVNQWGFLHKGFLIH